MEIAVCCTHNPNGILFLVCKVATPGGAEAGALLVLVLELFPALPPPPSVSLKYPEFEDVVVGFGGVGG